MIEEILQDVQLVEIDEGIFSYLEQGKDELGYDDKVHGYDLIVGSRLYNRLVWGNSPDNYRQFCQEAIDKAQGGIYLDAGCGSLVFTDSVYAQANNQLVVLLDRSLGMLAKGRQRIKKLKGTVPDNLLFLQGDIFNSPFQDSVFAVVASFGLLHIFDDKLALLSELERVKKGNLYFSSLVANNGRGRKYLDLLNRAGEVGTAYSSAALTEILAEMPFTYQIDTIGNMAYGKSG